MPKALAVKRMLTRIGASIPAPVFNYMAVGQWMRERGYDVSVRFPDRNALFNHISSPIADKRVLYLEFGVYKGRATRYWSKLLRNPNSHLHGFDSFEGLPEQFTDNRGNGYFSTNGELPKIDDPRVRFFKGWFCDTLPTYSPPEHDVLVVNMDADLYSSTAYVLNRIKDWIAPGTILYFDEFNHQQHEQAAFDELMRLTGTKFSLLGATTTLENVAFARLP